MNKNFIPWLLLVSFISAYGQGCPDEPWKKFYGSSAFLYVEYRSCTDRNHLSESGYITKIDLQSIDKEDTVVCDITITYSTKGKLRNMVQNNVILVPGGNLPFFVDAENFESLKVEVAAVRFHFMP